MKKKILLGILIILVVVLVCPACQEITKEDVDRESRRWWVICYKMLEDETPGQTNELITGSGGVEEVLEDEFGDFIERYDTASVKDKYRFVKRRNELMEKALIKFKGEDALKEIEGVWSLDEVPDLWEKVNNANE